MLVSSVQAVVACYVTALRVCTLVLFITEYQWRASYVFLKGRKKGERKGGEEREL